MTWLPLHTLPENNNKIMVLTSGRKVFTAHLVMNGTIRAKNKYCFYLYLDAISFTYDAPEDMSSWYLDKNKLTEDVIAWLPLEYEIKPIPCNLEELMIKDVRNKASNIEFFEQEATEKVRMLAVTLDGLCLRFIKDKTEALQIAAVQQNNKAFKYIVNPSEAVKLVFLKGTPSARNACESRLKSGEYLSEGVKELLLQCNGLLIQFIDYQSEKLQLIAVSQNPIAIRYITQPTHKVIEYVLNRDNVYAIKYFLKDKKCQCTNKKKLQS